ncbi:hypothetical protein RB614_24240 [Phytohabitans sp. ZYX-F-186]|uniref:SAM-dependent methyltransferase n=1 Tax=Phytohabitans maris TaxID=3071409 RepID=A0ABU0ZKQ2_9ACTN|nr:hypothetical protein [Phytohabitans sp. ZYX-F-186]MDQ7907636.1 hypothetical protein [Phytohabitans sp. ZYX-F-186]
MTDPRQRVADFWDEHTAAWLAGADPMPHPLPHWFDSYSGVGAGEGGTTDQLAHFLGRSRRS